MTPRPNLEKRKGGFEIRILSDRNPSEKELVLRLQNS